MKIGDRVQLDHTLNDRLHGGLTGRVVKINESAYPVMVDFGHAGVHMVAESEVNLVEGLRLV